jgi:hypothetical protein
LGAGVLAAVRFGAARLALDLVAAFRADFLGDGVTDFLADFLADFLTFLAIWLGLQLLEECVG